MRSSSRSTPVVAEAEELPVLLDWQLISQLLPKQSSRWCQVTETLWSIIALDTQRVLDQNNISQFIEVVYWRAHGKITDEEFSVLFTEWMKPQIVERNNNNVSANTSNANGGTKKKSSNLLNVMVLRSLIFEKKYAEADLDLFIGIIVHETNTRLLNATISYTNKGSSVTLQSPQPTFNVSGTVVPKVTFTALPSYNLEVVTSKWLELSEELFFLFDTPGYGSLKFDEIYFFMTGVVIGLQNWKNDLELENTLQLIHTSTMTLQCMKEFGVNIQPFLTPGRVSLPSIASPTKSKRPSIGQQNSMQKFEISLIMFKKYLLKKHLGEHELLYLIQYFQDAIERINKLAKLSNADELYNACSPIENLGNVIGSPRIWQHAVLLAAGFGGGAQNLNGSNGMMTSPMPSNLPPVLLFLLSDGAVYISALFRAIEFPIEGIGFGQDGFTVNSASNPLQSAAHALADYSNPLLSTLAANEELHENALRLFIQFRKWGHNPTTNVSIQNSFLNGNRENAADHQRDPIYQLILSALLQYKRLQHFQSAAFFDFAISQFGMSPQTLNASSQASVSPSSATSQYNHSLAILCHGLVPNNQEVLSEFGLIDNLLLSSNNDDNMTTTTYGSQSNASAFGGSIASGGNRYYPKVYPATTTTTVTSTAKRMLLDELNHELIYNEDDEDGILSIPASNSMKEIDYSAENSTVGAESERRGGSSNTRSYHSNKSGNISSMNSVSSVQSSATRQTESTSTSTGSLRISSIPIAEKRKSDLLQLNQKSNGTENKTTSKENNQKKTNGTPNYVKPTATSTAKFASGKYTTDVAADQQAKFSFPPPPTTTTSFSNIPSAKSKLDKKSSPNVIPPDNTTLSPVPPVPGSASSHGNVDVHFSSDSEFSHLDQIQWKSLLDTPLPANNFTQGTNNSLNNNNNGSSVPPSASAVPYGQQINSNSTRDEEHFSPVKLTNEESRLFAQLLISTSPHEQQRIIEALKKRLHNFSIIEPKAWQHSSNSSSHDINHVDDELSLQNINLSPSSIMPQNILFNRSTGTLPLPGSPQNRSAHPTINSDLDQQSALDEKTTPSEASSSNISAPSSVSDFILLLCSFYCHVLL